MDEPSQSGRSNRPARRGLAWLVLALALAFPALALEPTLVSIGTGGKTGVYYPAGGAICHLVDARRWQTGLRCLAEPSDGSIQNLRDVRSGARTFGIVQSDTQYDAVNGTGAFRDAGPDRELRSVLSLFREPLTVVARPDAGIATLSDLKGKRVSLGPVRSGGRATMGVVMQALGWTDADFAFVSDLAMPDLPRALCNQEIDAAVFIVAHPNLTVEDMISSCNAVLVRVDGPEIERMIAANPYYTPTTIAPGTYAGQAIGVPTFALTATLVTSSRTSPAVVYELTKAIFQNFDAFRATHPALADLDKIQMFSEGLTAPLHEGALHYFGEAKLR
jgi:TRAP transporter TAXI family solute receptor